MAPEARLRALIGDLKGLRLVDDTTVMLVAEPRGKSVQQLLHLEFPAQAAQMRSVRAALRTALDAQGVDPQLRDQLVLAVDEACTNIIRHAYCEDANGKIALHLSRERDMLMFELCDEAPAVDPKCLKARDLDDCKPGGLGVAFIETLMDDWKLEACAGGKGNVLRMHKRIGNGDDE